MVDVKEAMAIYDKMVKGEKVSEEERRIVDEFAKSKYDAGAV